MKEIIYSAPAKVILSGEHAVVFGNPALVSALDLRLKFHLFSDPYKKSTNPDIDFISDTVLDFLEKEKNPVKQFKKKVFNYKVISDIPVKRGLGSSAALSVAASAAFLQYYTSRVYPSDVVNNLAFKIEKKFHDNPSGVDNSACCFGGLVYFRKEFDFLKNISLLNFKIPKKIESKLYLIDSGTPKEKTSEMVKSVADYYRHHPDTTSAIFHEIEKCTRRLVIAVLKEDSHLFTDTLHKNNQLLSQLGLVSAKTQKLLTNLSQFGKGKITGAGGKKENSGFMLFLTSNDKALTGYLKLNRIKYFKFKQSMKGLNKDL